MRSKTPTSTVDIDKNVVSIQLSEPIYEIEGIKLKDITSGRSKKINVDGVDYILTRGREGMLEFRIGVDGGLERVTELSDQVEGKMGIGYRNRKILFNRTTFNFLRGMMNKHRKGKEERVRISLDTGTITFYVDEDNEINIAMEIFDPVDVSRDFGEHIYRVLYRREYHRRALDLYGKLRITQD